MSEEIPIKTIILDRKNRTVTEIRPPAFPPRTATYPPSARRLGAPWERLAAPANNQRRYRVYCVDPITGFEHEFDLDSTSPGAASEEAHSKYNFVRAITEEPRGGIAKLSDAREKDL